MTQPSLPLNEQPQPVPPRIREYFQRIYRENWRKAMQLRAEGKKVPEDWRR